MENIISHFGQDLKVDVVPPPISGLADEQDHFDLEDALSMAREASVQDEESEVFDSETTTDIEFAQGDREPPALRTERIGDNDVLYFDVDEPLENSDEDSLASDDYDIDLSLANIVDDIDFSEDELDTLQPVAKPIPSMFSLSYHNANNNDVSSDTKALITEQSTVSDEIDDQEDGSADMLLVPRTTPVPSMFSPSFKGAPSLHYPQPVVRKEDPDVNYTSSKNSPPLTNITEELGKRINDTTAKPAAESASFQASCNFTYSQPEGTKTFLPVCPTSAEVPTAAQEVAESAGCSIDAVQTVKNLSISLLHDAGTKMESPDAEKLLNQLDRDGLVEWNPNSISDGIGKDVNGNYTGLSLVQLSNSLSNFNEHFLIMEKELLKFECAIKQSRTECQLDSLGFNDSNNITHLSTVVNCLRLANKNMEERLLSLVRAVKGQQDKREGNGFPINALAATGISTAILGALYLSKK